MTQETISLNEAKAHLSELVRNIRENGASYTVTYRGEPVACFTPIAHVDAEQLRRRREAVERIHELRQHVRPHQPGDSSLKDMIAFGRK